MPMTNNTMAPPVEPNTPVKTESKPVLSADQIKEAAKLMATIAPNEETSMLDATKNSFDDQVSREEVAVAKQLSEAEVRQLQESGKKISDLVEDDAYNLNVAIHAGAMHDPNLLKVDLKDKNYVCRWGNTNPVRQSQLRAQGFRPITLDEVENVEHLEMFEDSQAHLVFADLIAMKIPRNVYYAGLRRNYQKSLHATNDKKAREAGAAHAKERLMGELKGAERSYMSAQEQSGKKPIYSPNIGV